MKTEKLILASAAAFMLFCCAHADVFSLWPFSGGDAWNASDPESVLSPAELHKERIITGGRELTMKVGLVRSSIKECFDILHKQYRDARFAVNDSSLLAEIKNKDGSRKRIYLISISGVYPVMQFSMELPPQGKIKQTEWPSEFPPIPDGTPVTVIRFPDRKAVYGAFSSNYSVQSTLPRLSASIKSMGWKPATAEHLAAYGGSGEVFIKDSPSSLMVIGFTPSKDGASCTGTIYMRELSGR